MHGAKEAVLGAASPGFWQRVPTPLRSGWKALSLQVWFVKGASSNSATELVQIKQQTDSTDFCFFNQFVKADSPDVVNFLPENNLILEGFNI